MSYTPNKIIECTTYGMLFSVGIPFLLRIFFYLSVVLILDFITKTWLFLNSFLVIALRKVYARNMGLRVFGSFKVIKLVANVVYVSLGFPSIPGSSLIFRTPLIVIRVSPLLVLILEWPNILRGNVSRGCQLNPLKTNPIFSNKKDSTRKLYICVWNYQSLYMPRTI